MMHKLPLQKSLKISKKNWPLLMLSFLLLSACAGRDAFQSSITSFPPQDMMQPRPNPDYFGTMNAALEGAQGLEADWLLEYSYSAEKTGIQLDSCQAYVNTIQPLKIAK